MSDAITTSIVSPNEASSKTWGGGGGGGGSEYVFGRMNVCAWLVACEHVWCMSEGPVREYVGSEWMCGYFLECEWMLDMSECVAIG